MNGLEMEGRGGRLCTWKLENLWEPLDVNVIFFKFQAFFSLRKEDVLWKFHETNAYHTYIGISSMNIFWVGWRKWLKRTWLNHIGHLSFRSHIHLRSNFCCTVVAQVENSSIWIEVEWSDVRCWLSIYTSKSVWFQLLFCRQHSWKYRETSNKSFHLKNRSSWATLAGNALLGWASWSSWGGWGWQDGLRTGTWRLNRCVQ